MSSLAERLLPISLVVHRIADDRTGHAVTATATAAEFGANDRDDLDPFFAQQSIRVRVSIVGKDDTRRRADKICAAIPLRPLALKNPKTCNRVLDPRIGISQGVLSIDR